MVQNAWSFVPIGQCPFSTFDLKLKGTAKALQGWSSKKVGHIETQLHLARDLIDQLEIAQEEDARRGGVLGVEGQGRHGHQGWGAMGNDVGW